MLWIIGAVSSILFGILIALLTKRSCSCVPNMALSVILIFVSAFSNIFATTTNLDNWGKITWSSNTILQHSEALISVNRIFQAGYYVCYIKAPSGELIELTYSDRDVKIMDNPKDAGKIETRKVTGTVKPDEWWNSFASGTREKEIYYIYAPNNKITVINERS